MTDATAKLRLDKWLWHARFFKTRTLAARQISDGRVRLNGTRIQKPAQTVSPGDVLTFAQADEVRVIRVQALGTRRGPAPEAQELYEDIAEKPAADLGDAQNDALPNPGYEGKGRPSKKDRRALDLSRRQTLE